MFTAEFSDTNQSTKSVLSFVHNGGTPYCKLPGVSKNVYTI